MTLCDTTKYARCLIANTLKGANRNTEYPFVESEPQLLGLYIIWNGWKGACNQTTFIVKAQYHVLWPEETFNHLYVWH